MVTLKIRAVCLFRDHITQSPIFKSEYVMTGRIGCVCFEFESDYWCVLYQYIVNAAFSQKMIMGPNIIHVATGRDGI